MEKLRTSFRSIVSGTTGVVKVVPGNTRTCVHCKAEHTHTDIRAVFKMPDFTLGLIRLSYKGFVRDLK